MLLDYDFYANSELNTNLLFFSKLDYFMGLTLTYSQTEPTSFGIIQLKMDPFLNRILVDFLAYLAVIRCG